MGIAGVVLDIILPVFGVLGFGYLAARVGWFDAGSPSSAVREAKWRFWRTGV